MSNLNEYQYIQIRINDYISFSIKAKKLLILSFITKSKKPLNVLQ